MLPANNFFRGPKNYISHKETQNNQTRNPKKGGNRQAAEDQSLCTSGVPHMSLKTSTYSLVCIWQSKHHSNASAPPAQAAPLRIAYWTSVLPVTPVRHIDSYTAKTAAPVPIDTQINAVCCYSITIEHLKRQKADLFCWHRLFDQEDKRWVSRHSCCSRLT